MNYNIRDELKIFSDEEIKAHYIENSINASVLCLNLQNDHNIGTIVRSASLFGFKQVIVIGKRHYNKLGTVGMHNYIPIMRIQATQGDHNENFDDQAIISVLDDLIQQGNRLIFIEQSQNSIPLTKLHQNLEPDIPVVFVMGNESNGLSSQIEKHFSGEQYSTHCIFVEIPQRGVGRSHNVSSAFSIVAWEYIRKDYL